MFLGGDDCRSRSGSSNCGGFLDGLLLLLLSVGLLGSNGGGTGGGTGSPGLRQEDDVDVVVDPLQQQLALEVDDGALLGGAEGAHEGLD